MQQVFVLGMGADRDAKSQVATRVQRAEQPTARLMAVEGGASTWVALKVPRGRLIYAYPMVVAEDVGFLGDVIRLQGGNLGFAFDMVEGSGAGLKAALEVLKDRLACAFLMAVDVVANIKVATRALRAVPCFARLMVVVSVAYLQDALKVLKVAHLCARDMVEESGASLMVVGSAQKVFTEAQTSVLLMVEERGVLSQVAQRVHEVELIAA